MTGQLFLFSMKSILCKYKYYTFQEPPVIEFEPLNLSMPTFSLSLTDLFCSLNSVVTSLWSDIPLYGWKPD